MGRQQSEQFVAVVGSDRFAGVSDEFAAGWPHYFVLAIPCFVLTLARCEFKGFSNSLFHPVTLNLTISSVLVAIASSPLAGIMSATMIAGLLQAGILLLFASALTSLIGSDGSNSIGERSTASD